MIGLGKGILHHSVFLHPLYTKSTCGCLEASGRGYAGGARRCRTSLCGSLCVTQTHMSEAGLCPAALFRFIFKCIISQVGGSTRRTLGQIFVAKILMLNSFLRIKSYLANSFPKN